MLSHAAFAVNFPEGMCANALSFTSALTCSMIAWPRWVLFGLDQLDAGVGEERVVAPGGEQHPLPLGHVAVLHPAHDQPGDDVFGFAA
jgi:hypothetical protein